MQRNKPLDCNYSLKIAKDVMKLIQFQDLLCDF